MITAQGRHRETAVLLLLVRTLLLDTALCMALTAWKKSVAFVLVGFAASRPLLLFVVERKGKSFKVEL